MNELSRVETTKGFNDPFAKGNLHKHFYDNFLQAILATAFVRFWHILLFYAGWATIVSWINHSGKNFTLPSTLLTVIGTIIGFVISYRTSSSFERYNEGRRLWAQIVINTRTFARTVWLHVPETNPNDPSAEANPEENKVRVLIEKKSAINLLEAFSVALKHYLRGEDGIYYKDLYYLVKHLDPYALPRGVPTAMDNTDSPMSPPESCDASTQDTVRTDVQEKPASSRDSSLRRFRAGESITPRAASEPLLPFSVHLDHEAASHNPRGIHIHVQSMVSLAQVNSRTPLAISEEIHLQPSRLPPKYPYFDSFPFYLVVGLLTRKSKIEEAKKAKFRAELFGKIISENLPLEITIYLSSYIAALQERKTEVPTINTLLNSLNQLIDALSGLERILTTPIPFSYSIHLWFVTIIYCLALPLQIWDPMKWVTVPATVVLAFIFFGFLAAGEEIENPFGYEANDLNLDHFTHNIIRNELRALTSMRPPRPATWAFNEKNDLVFATRKSDQTAPAKRVKPDEWIRRGTVDLGGSKPVGRFQQPQDAGEEGGRYNPWLFVNLNHILV